MYTVRMFGDCLISQLTCIGCCWDVFKATCKGRAIDHHVLSSPLLVTIDVDPCTLLRSSISDFIFSGTHVLKTFELNAEGPPSVLEWANCGQRGSTVRRFGRNDHYSNWREKHVSTTSIVKDHGSL